MRRGAAGTCGRLAFSLLLSAGWLSQPGVGAAAPREEAEVPPLAAGEDVVVYLRSGEAFSGRVVKRSATDLIIERDGHRFPFGAVEIARIGPAIGSGSASTSLGRSRPGERPDALAEQAGPDPLPADGGFVSAIIRYHYTGMKTGEETVYIDRRTPAIAWEAQVAAQAPEPADPYREWFIADAQAIYAIDASRELAVKLEREGGLFHQVFGNERAMGRPLGSDTVLGRTCTLYAFQGGTRCFWQGIVLRERVAREGSRYEKEAVQLELDVPIPAEKITLPEGIHVQTMDAMMKELGHALQGLQRSVDGHSEAAPQP